MAMLLLYAVCFADSTLRLFVAESLYRNIDRLKDGEAGWPVVCDGIPNKVRYKRSILRYNVCGFAMAGHLITKR